MVLNNKILCIVQNVLRDSKAIFAIITTIDLT